MNWVLWPVCVVTTRVETKLSCLQDNAVSSLLLGLLIDLLISSVIDATTRYPISPFFTNFSFFLPHTLRTMPRKLLTKQEWEDRLRGYAAGAYKFGTGKHHAGNSPVAAKIRNIKRCPLHKLTGQRTLSAKKVNCICGYHTKKSTAKKKVSYYVSVCRTLWYNHMLSNLCGFCCEINRISVIDAALLCIIKFCDRRPIYHQHHQRFLGQNNVITLLSNYQ